MGLREEIADKLDADEKLAGYSSSRVAFRKGNTTPVSRGGELGFSTTGNAVARSVLAVIDKYEPVEVWQREDSEHLCLPSCLAHDAAGGSSRWPRKITIYMKKQEPEPTDRELMRNMVEAWQGVGSNRLVREAIDAMAERLDKS